MTTTATLFGAAFTERTVEADGFTMRYFEAGTGDPLVVLHGAGGPQLSPALDLLAERFRVILFEMPGFGDQPNDRHQSVSEMADTMDLAIQELDLESYHLLGISFGGFVSTHLALDHPERLRSLVLEGPAVFRVGAPPLGAIPTADEMRTMFRRHPERVPVWEPPDLAGMGSKLMLLGRMFGAEPDYDEQLVARLSECSIRTLVVFGDCDGRIPPHNGRTFRRHMPNCSYVLVHQAAHDIQADRPEAFADLVGDFLTRGWAFLLPEESTLVNP